ncbi:unnamed protein product [Dimorphilus gyrociliatus]|uniref:Enoyl reductase (ER) domain-containing protein n=1 Tax=Dimorphilus gyrociliatus TaxID=2664684 RepID=A0A7I8W763_9ANNE|nr:unnamed protein product [Dimorphilus gyrociliatus]
MKSIKIKKPDEPNAKPSYTVVNDSAPILGEHDLRVRIEASCPSIPPTSILHTLYNKRNMNSIPLGGEFVGKITQIGLDVKRFKVGDRVAGSLSMLNETYSVCSNVIATSEYEVAKLDYTINPGKFVATLSEGLRAYVALHVLGNVKRDNSILIFDGIRQPNLACSVIAKKLGLQVFVTTRDSEETEKAIKYALQSIESSKLSDVSGKIIEETGEIGVDVVIDNGVDVFGNKDKRLPEKIDIIRCLGLNGRWITRQHDLQLDPPDSSLLYMKAASISYIPPSSLSSLSANKGTQLHIFDEIISLYQDGSVEASIMKTVSWKDALEFFSNDDPFERFENVVFVSE